PPGHFHDCLWTHDTVGVQYQHGIVTAPPAHDPVGNVACLALTVVVTLAIEHRTAGATFLDEFAEHAFFAYPGRRAVAVTQNEEGEALRGELPQPGGHRGDGGGHAHRVLVVDRHKNRRLDVRQLVMNIARADHVPHQNQQETQYR